VVGAFGIADPVKRLDAAIRALARIATAEVPGAMLIVVGQVLAPAYRSHLRRAGRSSLGIGERVRIFEQVAKGDF
jgi:hypothetical protein